MLDKKELECDYSKLNSEIIDKRIKEYKLTKELVDAAHKSDCDKIESIFLECKENDVMASELINRKSIEKNEWTSLLAV